jgi:hypothetical protein
MLSPVWITWKQPRMLARRVGLASLGTVTEPTRTGRAADDPGVELDTRTRAILDFERESWKLPPPKERAIRERFGFSAARYHQLLNRAIELPEALAYDPMLVRRLRRIREARRRRRVADQLGVRV